MGSPQRVIWILLCCFLTVGWLGCGSESREELLEAANQDVRAARQAVEAAEAVVEQKQEAIEAAEAARDEALEELEEAKQKLREAELTVSLHATDDVLFREVQRLLLEDEDLAGVAVRARVRDGVVTLAGSVPDEDLAELAVEIASDVPGVREVRSRIRVDEGDAADEANADEETEEEEPVEREGASSKPSAPEALAPEELGDAKGLDLGIEAKPDKVL